MGPILVNASLLITNPLVTRGVHQDEQALLEFTPAEEELIGKLNSGYKGVRDEAVKEFASMNEELARTLVLKLMAELEVCPMDAFSILKSIEEPAVKLVPALREILDVVGQSPIDGGALDILTRHGDPVIR